MSPNIFSFLVFLTTQKQFLCNCLRMSFYKRNRKSTGSLIHAVSDCQSNVWKAFSTSQRGSVTSPTCRPEICTCPFPNISIAYRSEQTTSFIRCICHKRWTPMHPLCIPLIWINLQFLSCSCNRENNKCLFIWEAEWPLHYEWEYIATNDTGPWSPLLDRICPPRRFTGLTIRHASITSDYIHSAG